MKKSNSKILQKKLAEVSKKIDSTNNNIEINEYVEDLLTSLFNVEFASLWFYNEKNMTLLRERKDNFVREISIEEKKGILYKCFMTQESKIYNYIASDKDYIASIDNPDNIKIKSKLIVPLLDNKKFIGMVTLYSSAKKNKKFKREDIKNLQLLSSYLINIIYKMHLPEKSCSCSSLQSKESKEIIITDREESVLSFQEENKERDKTIKNDMANFIHDIKTPANTLQGFLELLEDQITDKRLKEYILNAKESAYFISELTTEMLQRISLQQEIKKIQKKEFESIKFFSFIAEMFVSNMYEKNIDFNIYIDPLLPKTVKTDELKLKRVIVNLISNAYKFTPCGGSVEFVVKYNQESKDLLIYVKDEGIGIAKEKQEEIFKAFKQAGENISLHYGGTGLGLFICAEYVAALGGKLEIESELDKGSKFYFKLPLEIVDERPSFERIDNKKIKIAFLISSKNSFSLLNIARYFIRMGIKKENISVVSSTSEIAEDITHLVVYQHKFNDNKEQDISQKREILIVEENLFSVNSDELDENCRVIFQYDYYAEKLYKFLNSKKIQKILIVDDDKTSLLLLEKILESEHCEVEVAKNGKIALEMILDAYKKESPYNIVYIDNNMPLMNGLEVMQRVREFERDNNLIPLYAVSTSGDILDLNNRGKDFNTYIGKPFHVEEIRKILHYVKRS